MILIASIGGWCFNSLYLYLLFRPYSKKKYLFVTVRGFLPSIQANLANYFAAAITTKYLSEQLINEKLSKPGVFEKLKPQIEEQVDLFLKEKLPVAFPLLSKFMGEKTLLKFKEAFLEEIETIFPGIIKSYGENLQKEWQLQKYIESEIKSIPIPAINQSFKKIASGTILRFKVAGALAGAIIALFQCVVLAFVK